MLSHLEYRNVFNVKKKVSYLCFIQLCPLHHCTECSSEAEQQQQQQSSAVHNRVFWTGFDPDVCIWCFEAGEVLSRVPQQTLCSLGAPAVFNSAGAWVSPVATMIHPWRMRITRAASWPTANMSTAKRLFGEDVELLPCIQPIYTVNSFGIPAEAVFGSPPLQATEERGMLPEQGHNIPILLPGSQLFW